MTDAVRERPGFDARLALSDGQTRVEVVAPTLGWQIADSLLAISLLITIFVLGNLQRMPQGFEEFLAMRISVKSALLLAAFGVAWPVMLRACGLYHGARLRTGRGEIPRLAIASAAALLLAMVFPLTSRSGAFRPMYAVAFALAIAPATAAARWGVREAQRRQGRAMARRVVVVGSGPLAARMLRHLTSDQVQRWDVLGFVDDQPQESLAGSALAHLGAIADLEMILMRRVVDDVMICLPIKSRYEEIQHAIAASERVGVPAQYALGIFRTTLGPARLEQRANRAVLALQVAPHDYRLGIKRGMDVAGAAALLLALSPFMLAIAIAIRLGDGGPAFFAQERYGFMKRRFRMFKFRTMVADAEQRQRELECRNEAAGPVFKIRDDPRITRMGRFLRRSSLDELPQLWNVLTGEMSLVGPRPMAVRDVELFDAPRLMRRFSMRPGLTCLWQIRGRSLLGFDQWIALDLEYIDRWSLGLDLDILLRTLPAVVRGNGAT